MAQLVWHTVYVQEVTCKRRFESCPETHDSPPTVNGDGWTDFGTEMVEMTFGPGHARAAVSAG